MSYLKYATFLSALLICTCNTQVANAQYLKDERALTEDAVDKRVPYELRPKTLAFHGFLYSPKVSVETLYDTNVLAQSRNEEGDFAVKIKPSIIFNKPYRNHLFKFGAQAEITRYLDLTDENTIEPEVFFNGTLNNGGSLSVPFNFSYSQEARDRATPQRRNFSKEPTKIDTATAELGFMKQFNRLSLGFMGSITNKSFSNEVDAITGAPIINDDIDRTEYKGTFKMRYEFPGETKSEPRHTLYADIYTGKHDYKRLSFENGTYSGNSGDRNTAGFIAGIESNYKGFLYLNLGGGYERQFFKDNNFEDTDLYNIKANVLYNIIPKLSLKLGAGSSIKQDNGFIKGVKQYNGSFGADYELQHDLYTGANFRYINYTFIDSARETEQDYNYEVNLRKLHSEHLSSRASIVYQNRVADNPQFEFDRMIFMLGLNYQF